MWSTAISNEQFATCEFLTAEKRVLQVGPIDSVLQNLFHGMLTVLLTIWTSKKAVLEANKIEV